MSLSGWGRAKEIFWVLFILLGVSFIVAASLTFQWWPSLSQFSEDAVKLQGAVALEDKIAQLEAANPDDNNQEVIDLKIKADNIDLGDYEEAIDKKATADRLLAELATFQYLAWVFAAWTGASIYLIGQIGSYYPKIKKIEEEGDKADFLKYTYWYASTFLKAPILALVVMWFLINLNVGFGADGVENGLGVSVNFSQLGPYVMLGVAFVLGFYGRVARKQLDIIAKYLFTRAWALAEQGFKLVVPAQKSILINDMHAFSTDPPMEVVWSATLGTIDPEKGTYEAPKEVAMHDKDAIIRASLRAEPASTDFAMIKLKAIRITGGAEKVEKGEDASLSFETKLENVKLAEAIWKVGGKDASVKGQAYLFETEKREAGKYKVSVTAKHEVEEKDGEDGATKKVSTDISDEIEIIVKD